MTASLLTRPETPIIPFLSPTWQQTFEDLLTAQSLLFVKGWTTDHYVDKRGRICLLHALKMATGHRSYQAPDDRFVAAVQAVLREIPPDDRRALSMAPDCFEHYDRLDRLVARWNDHCAGEVVAVDRVLFQAIARTGDLCLRGVTAADA